MAFGLVQSSAERSTSRHGHPQASAPLLYRLALVLVLGFIVWKWLNSVHSPDSNQEIVVLVLEILLVVYPSFWHIYSRKLGNCKSLEGLHSFKPSKGTNLLTSTNHPDWGYRNEPMARTQVSMP